jgi:pimeloyl-ACP methyl ester carboxylesterase
VPALNGTVSDVTSDPTRARQPSTSTTRRVTGAGVDLAVTEWGDPAAPTVVLVHGYPDTSALWRPVVAELEPRYHVVTYDVRGAGDSTAPDAGRAGYTLDLLVDDLAAVADATSPGRPVHLVGGGPHRP